MELLKELQGYVVMNLILDAHVENDTAVVTCRGPIVHGATVRRFRERVSGVCFDALVEW